MHLIMFIFLPSLKFYLKICQTLVEYQRRIAIKEITTSLELFGSGIIAYHVS